MGLSEGASGAAKGAAAGSVVGPWGTAIGGAIGFLGGLIKSKSKQQQQSSTLPTLDPAYGPLQQMVLQHVMSRLQNPSGLPAGFESTGIAGINNTYDQAAQGVNNSLVTRGLSTSPVAANTDAVLGRGRAGDINSFRTNLPLIARQLQDADVSQAYDVLGLGRGSTTTGNATNTTGGGAAGGAENLAQIMGFLIGSGKLKIGGSGGNGLPNQTQPYIPEGWGQ